MYSERLDWDTLRVFRVVAELRSMSGAAARLGESPPTISRKIDDLEANLGAQLLIRSTRGVELTDAGRVVLRYAHQMADAADVLSDQAGAKRASVEGRIVMSTGDGIGPYWLAARMHEFQEANPRVQIRMIVKDEPADVLNGEADIALHFSEPKSHELLTHKLGVQHYIGFAARDYFAGRKPPESLFEYYKHRCLMHSSYVNQVERWAPKMSELRRMIDYAFISNSGTALIQSCAEGGGVAILPSFVAAMEDRIVPLDLPEIAPIQFWVVYTERFRRLPEGQAFVDWLRKRFEQPDAIWFREEFIHPREILSNVHIFPGAAGKR
ncbi:LysR family transcriptional regulator [Hyphomonas sp. WL0036]|uniref:LysR family transcriptional regulator n=1 Tax=Hyphomonas sediminis TaxID=2866160 RepID=UPI001C7E3691|nr:LysR family transcriptional regulator [Hyphomonas sediminis]MBY9066965.1 LysR family transcriptional regulator [Hyphomonas sediminis]